MTLRTDSVVKTYGSLRAVDEVDLEVNRGEIVGLLGPNGAGKTTTFYMIVGQISPDSGRIFLDEEDITRLPMYKRARQGIGYLAQEASVFRKMSVRKNLLTILEGQDMSEEERKKRADELLEEFSIERIAGRQGYQLSGGERRRVEIARALTTDPSFILLDEPFSGVDPIAVNEIQDIIQYLKEKGLGVLVTDHSVRETLDTTDRAYIMHEGEILLSGSADEVADSKEAREFYLGERFKM
ncbi:LPS export ABC transporter ATP-binding protein [Halarsenatibacter silvermanii]|uniref:Lipopolysaccharide export system ATP-binding protein n=1 Tax=Halarsenatibacter silvermanii TaxID=321763 RepID=A0A1G9HS06_9FIRM|nr:LPS export ABC transporter ATP-binding protein [Halarsenatibacter silvermanii]SDL15787.1 lipopolysaccharide export system ATP-binding protein [Halarsenatibacter silvermanii]